MDRLVWFSILFAVVTSQPSIPTQPQVTLEMGSVRGIYQETYGGRQIASFLSIPYAKQPMGRHRFKDSIEMNPWLGVYNASLQPPDCLHIPPHLFGQPASTTQGSEDCLYINVHTPHVPLGTVSKPLLDVVVYIFGSTFMFYSSAPISPRYLLDKDLVLVTFNYRLGPLGFLSSGDGVVPGNAALKDQVLALRWVQRHISAFGGDPKKVTLAGQSAGASCVHLHMLSPLSRGLFHKAIMTSGSALNPFVLKDTQEKTRRLAANLGCAFQDSQHMVKCLRSRPASHIVHFSENLLGWLQMPIAPWAATLEATPVLHQSPGSPQPFLTEQPLDIITSGRAADVPILFSHTSHEGTYPAAGAIMNDVLRQELSSRWDEVLPYVLDFPPSVSQATNIKDICQKIKQHYLNDMPVEDKQAVQPLLQMVGDRLVKSGISESSLLHAQKYQSPVYQVRFSYESGTTGLPWTCNCPDKIGGAIHYDDAGLMLDSNFLQATDPLDIQTRSRLIDLWYTFITTSKPEFGGVAVPDVKTGLPSLSILDIGLDGNPQLLTETDPGNRSFWQSIQLAMQQPNTQRKEEL